MTAVAIVLVAMGIVMMVSAVKGLNPLDVLRSVVTNGSMS